MMFDEDDRIFVEMQKKHRNQNTPKSLYDICLSEIVHDPSIICYARPDIINSPLRLKEDIILPREICERLLEMYQKSYAVSDKFINIFKDRSKTRIKSVHLDGSVVTDAGFKLLIRHNLQSITLTKCEKLSLASLEEISHRSSKLVSLHVGGNVNFFNEWAAEWDKRGFAFRAPRLRRLILHQQPCPNLRLELLPTLTHLDLSECLYLFNLHTMSPLKNLTTLILYNVPKLHELFDWICSLKKLRILDLSQCRYEGGRYDCPNQVLTRIVESLPELESLDISGTNLAGTGVAEGGCDVPGLASRIARPLDFLGLYGTQHAACCRHDIPAIKITGHANESQIMTASIAYMKRPEFLTRVLNDLYHLFRNENDKHPSVPKSLCVVLESMETHLAEKHIQISGSATLFYIVKGKEKSSLPIEMKQRIVSALLNGMETHMDDDTMMRNGCLTLCQFKIPTDVMFEYKRIVTVLLHGVADSSQEGFVQRIAIYLLNSLACQVDGRQKQFLGDSGAISKMLVLIADRLERRICDDVLEVAWSTMWNVTDETPDNCKRFLDDNGLYFFLTCLERFPGKEELLRNMMGLLGNVAEVAHLRPVFMDTQLLQVFSELLESTSDGIERPTNYGRLLQWYLMLYGGFRDKVRPEKETFKVSYNAAGVLAHLASDGPAAWRVRVPERSEVLKRMDDAIKRWSLSTKRNINYRSFQPILSLLGAYHTPACQYWALWALANLTTVYPEKYCSLVEAEKGGDLLKEVIDHPDPCDDIKTLAKLVWHNCYY